MSFDDDDDDDVVSNGAHATTDLLIDTSGGDFSSAGGIVAQHSHHAQPASFIGGAQLLMPSPAPNSTTSVAAAAAVVVSSQPQTSAKIAPEAQPPITYSIHPAFAALDAIDALLVKQRADCERTCCGFESTNSYVVRTANNEPVLRAVEQSNCLERCFCEQSRRYELKFAVGDEVVARVVKPHRVSRLCCYASAVSVESPADNPIGTLKQTFTLFGHSKFAVFDVQYSAQRPVFVIESMSCRYCCNVFVSTCCCVNRAFRVLSLVPTDGSGGAEQQQPPPPPLDSSTSSDDTGANDANASQANRRCRKAGKRRQVALIARDVSALVGVCSSGNADATWTTMAPPLAGEAGNEQSAEFEDSNNNNNNNNNIEDQQQAANGGVEQQQPQVRVNPQTTNTCLAFGIQFSANLEPRHKVLLLAACFMLDFYYFEADRRRKKLLVC